jgi:hypothetical protein
MSSGPLVTTTLPAVSVADHVHVRVAADDGSVRVTTADITQVEMRVESSGYDLGRDLELSLTPHGREVDVVARTREHWQLIDLKRRSLRIEVVVPRDADLEVRSGDGSVELEGLAGSVDVHTGDGSVAVRGARGRIRLSTGDGSIHARDLDGRVEASSGDGSVELDGRFDALSVETSDGGLVANARPGSRVVHPWHLQTGDGSVALGLPSDLGAHIDASTGDGSVHSTIPLVRVEDSHAEGDIHGGGPAIVVRTGDGSIRLTQI